MTDKGSALWRIQDVALYLGRSPRWLSYALRRTSETGGSIPHFKLPGRGIRFDPVEIEAWVRAGCPPAAVFRRSFRKGAAT